MVKTNGRKIIRKKYALLSALTKLKKDEFDVISNYLNDDAYEIFFESIHNSIYNPKVSLENKNKLKEVLWDDRKKIRRIANKKVDFGKRKKLISQVGAGFPLIASLVIPIIAEIITSFARKKRVKKDDKLQ